MAAVYSKLFIATAGLLGAVTFTVPSTDTAIVNTIDVYSSAILPAVVRFQDGNTGQTIWFYDFSAVSNQWAQWTGRQVFFGGAIIQMSAGTNPADVRVSGYLLTP
jgi:hypothetical protein